MTNPANSVLKVRYLYKCNSDRSLTYSFGFAIANFLPGSVLDSLSDDQIIALSDILPAFVNTAPPGSSTALGYYLSPSISRATNDAEVTLTDISNQLGLHEPAGSPFSIIPFTPTGTSGSGGLPEQVCQTISFRANYGTDPEFGTHLRPRASDRNRLYFGPLSSTTIQADSETPSRIEFATTFLDNCSNSLTKLQTDLAGDTGTDSSAPSLVAWSRKEAAVKPCVDYSQQLFPTTQRRRIDSRPPLMWTAF